MSITFDEACKIAYDYYVTERKETGLCSAKDIGEQWLFEAGDPNIVYYGLPSIAINKKSGSASLFLLPNEENFKLLDTATEMCIPERYEYKIKKNQKNWY